MAMTSLDLVNRALVKIGAAPITSFNDTVSEAKIAKLTYSTMRDALLSAYPWSFATMQRPLVRILGRPIADYEYAFQLPNDFLRVLSAGTNGKGRGLEYKIVERRLHCDSDHVILSYIFKPLEASFPPFFDQALIYALAAEFCLPITGSSNQTESLAKLAELEFKRARQIDASQDTPNQFEDNSLIEARY